jgi:hypothetical protein
MLKQNQHHCPILQNDCWPIGGKFRMNFARYECDRRAMQSAMRNNAFSLQIRNDAVARDQ